MTDAAPASLLLLAGTTEAAGLAAALQGRGDVAVLASLAGRTASPSALPCPVRVGGFGGPDGLARALVAGGHRLLVDATHPFAATMPRHAAEAAERAGVPRLRLVRPPWAPGPGDRWVEVDDLAAAAAALAELDARRVLLTTGRLELAPFAALTGTWFLVRSIEQPDPQPLPDARVLLARGPFTVEGEEALLHEHRIDAIVTKNSGGAATAAKLAAARELGVPVVVVRRPPVPPGPLATDVAAARAWIDGQLAGQEPGRTIR